MSVENVRERETLRCLRCEQLPAILGRTDCLSVHRPLDRVGDLQDGQGGPAKGSQHPINHGIIDQRPSRVLDQHHVGSVHAQRLEAGEDGALARGGPSDRLEQVRRPEPKGPIALAMVAVKHGQHPADVGAPRERFDRPGYDRPSGQQPVLLGDAAHALSGSGGDDDDGDCFLGRHEDPAPTQCAGLAAHFSLDKPLEAAQ